MRIPKCQLKVIWVVEIPFLTLPSIYCRTNYKKKGIQIWQLTGLMPVWSFLCWRSGCGTALSMICEDVGRYKHSNSHSFSINYAEKQPHTNHVRGNVFPPETSYLFSTKPIRFGIGQRMRTRTRCLCTWRCIAFDSAQFGNNV